MSSAPSAPVLFSAPPAPVLSSAPSAPVLFSAPPAPVLSSSPPAPVISTPVFCFFLFLRVASRCKKRLLLPSSFSISSSPVSSTSSVGEFAKKSRSMCIETSRVSFVTPEVFVGAVICASAAVGFNLVSSCATPLFARSASSRARLRLGQGMRGPENVLEMVQWSRVYFIRMCCVFRAIFLECGEII